MPSVSVIITVDRAANLDAVKAACERVGLTGAKVLPAVGLITGFIEANAIDELARIPGVRAVELERQIILHPPRR